MSCSCGRTPLRIFVQGLSQVHQMEAVSHRASAFRLKTALPMRQSRGIHLSSPARREAEAASENHPVENPTTTEEAQPDRVPSGDSAKTYAVHDSKDFDDHLSWRQTPSTNERALPPRRPKLPLNLSHASAAGGAKPASEPHPPREQTLPSWRIQKEALKKKFPDGWKPRKRLSPDALAGIRALNAQFPDVYTTEALANKFEVPAEAIRRILKSKWQPNAEEEKDRQDRWLRRGVKVWEYKVELGVKPPKKWREMGVARDPGYHERVKRAQTFERKREDEEQREYRARLDKERGTRPDGESRGGRGQG